MNGHKFCGQCGSELEINTKFCSHCGAPVQPTETPTQPTVTPAQPTAAPAQPVAPIASKKVKKPVFFAVAAIVIFAIIAGTVYSIIDNLPKTRTVAVYMIGSNLESQGGAGSKDIEEMIDSKFDEEYTKVVVYTGGSKAWGLDEISPNENAIFEVTNSGIEKVKTYEKKVMTKGETLTEYLDYVYDNYKTDYYDLILWDHGGGPISGYGSDENSISGTPMKLTELKDAIADSSLVKANKKFDIIGFDACLMGSIEVGTALSDYANYLVASEESEPGNGWNYAFLKTIDGKTKAPKIGTAIVDSFMHHYDDYPYEVGLSLAVIDLKEMDTLGKKSDALFNLVNEEVNRSTFSEYSRILTRSNVYGYTGRDSESFDLVDLKDLASSLESKHPNEVKALNSAIEKAVVYNDTNIKSTNGISVYFPTNNKKYIDRFMSNYRDASYSEDYYTFLKKYSEFITGTKYISRSTYSDLKEEKKGNGVSVELTDELADNYQKAEVIIYRKLGDNVYSPVYRGSNVSLDGKTLSTDNTNLQFVVKYKDAKTGKDDAGWISLFEKSRNDEYAEYTSFGVLYYADEESVIGYSPKSYEMHLRLNKGEKVAKVTDIRVQNTEDGLAGKISFDPKNIKIIEMTVSALKLFDDKGNRLDTPGTTGTLYGTSLNIEKGDTYEIVLEDLSFDFGNMYEGKLNKSALSDYYAEFIVYDTQGDAHRLNLIHIK